MRHDVVLLSAETVLLGQFDGDDGFTDIVGSAETVLLGPFDGDDGFTDIVWSTANTVLLSAAGTFV